MIRKHGVKKIYIFGSDKQDICHQSIFIIKFVLIIFVSVLSFILFFMVDSLKSSSCLSEGFNYGNIFNRTQ